MRHYNPRAVLFCVLAVLAGLTTSCTNDDTNPLDDELQSSTDTTNQDGSDGDNEDTTTSSSTSTTEAQPEADLDDLATIWQELFTATGLPADQRTPALQAIETLDESVIETADGLLLDLATAEAYTYPNFTREFDGTVTIADCTIYLPEIWDSNTHLHQATATPNPNGTWTITNLERQTRHCVPAELAQGALNGYQAYVEARSAYWNPPDPNHPGIQATLTGELLDFTPERLTEANQAGQYAILDDEVYPEVTDVFGPDRLIITDCRSVDEETGLYQADGQRIGSTPGDRDLYDVTMVLTDDGWKAESVEGQFAVECPQAPTPAGRPQI